MGMDVFGRNPSAERGRYFRASIWMWHPIHDLIGRLCSDLLDSELIHAIAYNDGAGPDNQVTCTRMADRFSQWLAAGEEGYTLPCSELQITDSGQLVTGETLDNLLRENPGLVTRSPYWIGRDDLQEWVTFLRNCGGFSVY